MNKSLVALFAAFIAAATIFSSAAEAGLRIHFGFGGLRGHHGGGTASATITASATSLAAS